MQYICVWWTVKYKVHVIKWLIETKFKSPPRPIFREGFPGSNNLRSWYLLSNFVLGQ